MGTVTYPDWKAPAQDGQVLVWPAAEEILADTVANHRALRAADVRIQNLTLAELRRDVRASNRHDDAIPLIFDGHQTELYHAGVWAKTVLADAVAERVSGAAMHLAVDTDAPKHLILRWPGGAEPITDDPRINSAHWCGLVAAPTAQHIDRLKSEVSGGMVGQYFEAILSKGSLSQVLMDASHTLDVELGLRHRSMLASPLWESRGFLVFVHHIVAQAARFATSYNAALAGYRKEKRVRTPKRPMPDLAVFDASVELPLWLDSLSTGDRQRPSVFAADGGYLISHASGDEFHFDPSAEGFDAADRLGEWLKRNQLRLSPRALTLTMFVRLCLADQFVHGIGGARYDQVTDHLIADFFGITPRFCVTTATMYLPEAAGQQRTCLSCIEQEGHKLRHSLLGDAKRPFLAKIESAPRRSAQRYEAFAQMHRELAGAVRTDPAVRTWEQRFKEAQTRDAAESVLFDRELFYALQPRERLAAMIERYRQHFASP